MQVNVIRGGDTAYNSLLYPPPDQGLLDYLGNSLQQAKDKLGEFGRSFYDSTMGMFNKHNSADAINASKLLLQSTGSHFNEHVIYSVGYNNFTGANLIMQRYIMSEPSINELHRVNMCHGYQETFFDNEPGIYGEDRTDYRRVMDGALQFDDEHAYVNYYTQNDPEDELCILDKISIRDTWEVAVRLLNEGVDPTSPDLEEI